MRAAIAFLTPFGRAATPSRRAMGWFPVVGVAIGVAVGVLWWGSSRAFPPVVAAAVAVAADALFTGGLHLDGLADAADGLLAPMDGARRLEVMREPAIGAFGVVAVAVVVLLRFAGFAGARPSVLVVAALWGTSRAAMVVITRLLPYARHEGLATAFLSDGSAVRTRRGDPSDPTIVLVALGVALCVVLAVAGRGLHGVAALGGAVVGCAAVALLARARIGGFTGDVLGAAGVVGETVGLLVLTARWT